MYSLIRKYTNVRYDNIKCIKVYFRSIRSKKRTLFSFKTSMKLRNNFSCSNFSVEENYYLILFLRRKIQEIFKKVSNAFVFVHFSSMDWCSSTFGFCLSFSTIFNQTFHNFKMSIESCTIKWSTSTFRFGIYFGSIIK